MSYEEEKKDQPNTDVQQNTGNLNRRSLLKRGTFWGGVSALASVFGLTPLTANAATPSSSSTQIVALTGPEAQKYIRLTLASKKYKSFQMEQSGLLQQGFTLNESGMTALLITTTTEKKVFVRVPISGGAGYSFYGEAITYGSSKITETLAGLFLTRPDQNIAAHLWKQAEEVLNIILTPSGYTVDSDSQQLLPDADDIPLINVGCFLSTLNSCLAGAGISAWAIALIGFLCGLACAATIGAGCIACIFAITAISGATLGACVAYAQNRCP